MKGKIVGFVWDVDRDEFVHMVELSDADRGEIEEILAKYETDGESFPLVR